MLFRSNTERKKYPKIFLLPEPQVSWLRDIRTSRLLFRGHTEEKVKPYYSNDGKLCGIPDYIFQNPLGERFVLEEKHSWSDDELREPWENNRLQILGYIYGLESLNLAYGYLVYFQWMPIYKRRRGRKRIYRERTGETYRMKIFKIERSEKKATKEQIHLLEDFFEVEKNSLMIPYLSEKIYYEISEEDCADQVLKVAEERVKYEKKAGRK